MRRKSGLRRVAGEGENITRLTELRRWAILEIIEGLHRRGRLPK